MALLSTSYSLTQSTQHHPFHFLRVTPPASSNLMICNKPWWRIALAQQSACAWCAYGSSMWLWMCIFFRCEWCELCANLPDYKTFKRIVHTRAIYVIENNMQSFKVTKTTCQMVCVSPIHATNSSNKTIQWIVRRDKRNSTAFIRIFANNAFYVTRSFG